MKQLELFRDERGLFERLCTRAELEAGFLAVKRNGGSPGIDGVTVSDFDSRRDEELKCLKRELESWTYQPSPVRRVEIPKPGKDAGVRLLGIPCVRDRVVQATLKRILEHAVCLGATALGLGACGIGAIYDGEARRLLGLNPASALVYLVAAGGVKGS